MPPDDGGDICCAQRPFRQEEVEREGRRKNKGGRDRDSSTFALWGVERIELKRTAVEKRKRVVGGRWRDRGTRTPAWKGREKGGREWGNA